MKKNFIITTIGFLMILGALASVSAAETESAFKSWSKLKPGSFITYANTSETAGVKATTEMTYTLKEVTPAKLVFELKTVTIAMGNRVEAPPQTFEVTEANPGRLPAGGGVGLANARAGGANVQTTQEKLEIKGKMMDTTKLEVKTEAAGNKNVTTMWFCDELPGGLAKTLTVTEGAMKARVEMVVTDFKKVD